jgi:hypothetical protein
MARMLEAFDRLQKGESLHDGGARLPPRPYPGLRSFTPAEGDVFFGRERMLRLVREELAAKRLLFVIGGSGSGKSSLVRAGIMPRLTGADRIPGRTGNWYAAEFRPRTAPMEELATSLGDLIAEEFPDQSGGRDLDAAPEGDAKQRAKAARDRFMANFCVESGARADISPARRLLDFVLNELNERDARLTRGFRSGRPNLLLVIDQFEEVFRPEVELLGPAGSRSLHEMLVELHEHLAVENRTLGDKSPRGAGGLYVIATMRSEEYHRIADHPGLARVANSGNFMIDLFDPGSEASASAAQDSDDLRAAIVSPARRVMVGWGLGSEAQHGQQDWPFDPDAVTELLEAARLLSMGIGHRPDVLPLLQHALRVWWEKAVESWRGAGAVTTPLLATAILQGGGTAGAESAVDLVACLESGANEAALKAKHAFVRVLGSDKDGSTDVLAEAALQAIFRALARVDDRGNLARRFADSAAIAEYLIADLEGRRLAVPEGSRILAALDAALRQLSDYGYIAGGELVDGRQRPWDISHEALLRNWSRCRTWLAAPIEAARALESIAQQAPALPPDASPSVLRSSVSKSLISALKTAVGDRPTLPQAWTDLQLEGLLARSEVARSWGVSRASRDDVANVRTRIETTVRSAEVAHRLADDEKAASEARADWQKRLIKLGKIAGAALLLAAGFSGYQWLEARGAHKQTQRILENSVAYGLTTAAVPARAGEWPPVLLAYVLLGADLLHDDRFRNMFEFRDLPERQRIARSDWDWAARSVLGFRYRLIGATEFGNTRTPERTGRLFCVTPSKDDSPENWGQAVASLPLPSSQGSQYAGVRLSQESLLLGTRVRSGESFQAARTDFGILVTQQTRACLSENGTLLVVAQPNNPKPELYELQWTPCPGQRECDSDQNGGQLHARFIPVIAGANAGWEPPQGSFPCAVSVAYYSVPADPEYGAISAASEASLVRISFDPRLDGVPCDIVGAMRSALDARSVELAPTMWKAIEEATSFNTQQPFDIGAVRRMLSARGVSLPAAAWEVLEELSARRFILEYYQGVFGFRSPQVSRAQPGRPAQPNCGQPSTVEPGSANPRRTCEVRIPDRLGGGTARAFAYVAPAPDNHLRIELIQPDATRFFVGLLRIPSADINYAWIDELSGDLIVEDSRSGQLWRILADQRALARLMRLRACDSPNQALQSPALFAGMPPRRELCQRLGTPSSPSPQSPP